MSNIGQEGKNIVHDIKGGIMVEWISVKDRLPREFDD